MGLRNLFYPGKPRLPDTPPEPELFPVRALTWDEVGTFWSGAPLRLYTARYLEKFCEVNGLKLVDPEDAE